MLRSPFSGRAALNRVARSFLNQLLNQPCPICDRPTAQTFCIDCDRQLLESFRRCVSPQPTAAHSLSVTSLGTYDGALKRAILAMKYSNRPDVAYPLGTALASYWQQQAIAKATPLAYVLPIPLHAKRQRSRGYNQAERIANAFCKVSGLPLLPHGLQRAKETQPQHSLGLNERQKNLDQVFQVGESLRQAAAKKPRSSQKRCSPELKPTVLLIDDIYTTGATAQSAAATLERAGFPVIGIAVLAQASSG